MSITCILDKIDRVTAECRYNATEFNKMLHIIAGTEAEYQSDAESTKDTPYLDLTVELWGVFGQSVW